MIRKLVVANRGEIAIRIFRTARSLGVRTVALYSEADAQADHVTYADESVCIGPPEPAKSYLDQGAVLEACKMVGADAVHPGYGFLSERADFSRACESAGLTFVGPPAAAMDKLGAKIESKQLAVSLGVPVAPGYFEPGAGADQLASAAAEIGFPVLLKASAGGGGRGMRIVRDPGEFEPALVLASKEALDAFGDGEMMVEKFIDRPRHIEVQLLADKHGNVACLFERECSLQRRHQKLIEESPAPGMTDSLWKKMRDACVSLATGAGYVGAGTVEFMVAPGTEEFYFLEVNARLQVEHPVTEQVTGLDLVEWQLRIASGEVLDLDEKLMLGDRSAICGHAIEARIVAEDPAAGFMPSVGKIHGWAMPEGPGTRCDTGFSAGSEVTRYYDSLLAKLIVHGGDRRCALRRLQGALRDCHVLGLKTNVEFLLDLSGSDDFVAGKVDTGWVDRNRCDWRGDAQPPLELGQLLTFAVSAPNVYHEAQLSPAWSASDGFRLAK